MKLKISMFVLPQEIDLFEITLHELKKNSFYTHMDVQMDATLCLSNELTDWKASSLPSQYFAEKFNKINKLNDWCENISNIEYGTTILGCVSKRRESSNDHSVDAHMWLDCDMMFPEYTLCAIENAIEAITPHTPYYIVTPELVKIWDDTWNPLVNPKYINEPYNFNQTCDPYKIVKETRNNEAGLQQLSGFKFAGGWVTVISDEILQKAPIPVELGHYGLEDMFITHASSFLVTQRVDARQFVIRNLVVCENHKYRDDSYITNHITSISKKDEFRKIAQSNFALAFDKYVKDYK